MKDNKLTTLSEYIFGPGYFRDRPYLHFYLKGNPMVCDNRLCWLKRAEAKGWISFVGGYFGPDCVNMPDLHWNEVDLDC